MTSPPASNPQSVNVVVAAHASADGRDATRVLRAGVLQLGEDEDSPRDGALLGVAEACNVPAAARLSPGAVVALERHGVSKLRVDTAAAAAEAGAGRGGARGACVWVGAWGPRQFGLLRGRRCRPAWRPRASSLM